MTRGTVAYPVVHACLRTDMDLRARIDELGGNSSPIHMDTKLRPYLTYLVLQLDLPKFLDIVQQPFICSLLRFQQETPSGDPWFVDTPLEGLPLTLEELYEACRTYADTNMSASTNTSDRSLQNQIPQNETATSHSEREIHSVETGPGSTHATVSYSIQPGDAHCSRRVKSRRALDTTPRPKFQSKSGAARWERRSRTLRRHAWSTAAGRTAATSSPSVPQRARGCIRRDWLRAWERVRRRRLRSKAREP